MDTIIVKIDQFKPDPALVEIGANIIRNGGTVIFPTETVYGLGANGLSQEACMKIFKAKERPADNPLILHVSSVQMLETIAHIDPETLRKISKFWPGPLTVLLKKKETVPESVSAGLPTVAVRMPDNPLALEMIRAAGVPVAAPSANLSTRPSITDSAHAIAEMYGRVDLIYDAGRTTMGIESTILDLQTSPPRLLRSGSTTLEVLSLEFGRIELTDVARGVTEGEIALTPGMKYRHYAPGKPLYLMQSLEDFKRIVSLTESHSSVLPIGCSEFAGESRNYCDLGSISDLRTVGSNLFSAFRKLDSGSFSFGVIHPVPEHGLGLGIMNRIRKATNHRTMSAEEIIELIDSEERGSDKGHIL